MTNDITPKVIVSGCLLGNRVQYDGGDCLVQHTRLLNWQNKGLAISVCPEILGGLPVPRAKSTIHGPESGAGVLKGKARIINCHNEDVTESYLNGARNVLAMAKKHNIRVAILKENSPSCGSHYVYSADGMSKIPGMGSTAAFLLKHGLHVFSENEIDKALELANKLSENKPE